MTGPATLPIFPGPGQISLDPRDGEPDSEAIRSGPAGHSGEDLRHQLLGLSRMYRGLQGADGALGIGHRVRQLSQETDQRMTTAIADSLAAADGLSGSLESMIANEPDRVMAVYESIKTLQRVLNTEVVSSLGVTVGFSDTDGDS